MMTIIYNRSTEKEKRKALRNNLTEAETFLWLQLRKRQLNNIKFRCQYSIGPYIIDFYSPEVRIAIEVDGKYHEAPDVKSNDQIRQTIIENLGIKVLRFTNEEIITETSSIIQKIKLNIEHFSPSYQGGDVTK